MQIHVTKTVLRATSILLVITMTALIIQPATVVFAQQIRSNQLQNTSHPDNFSADTFTNTTPLHTAAIPTDIENDPKQHFTIDSSVLQVNASAVIRQNRQYRITVYNYGEVNLPVNFNQIITWNGQILIPLRSVSDALGFNLSWDSATATITLIQPNRKSSFRINTYRVIINGESHIVEHPVRLVDGITMIPLVTLAEVAELLVRWDYNISNISISERITIDYWPENLPRHTPGSIRILNDSHFAPRYGSYVLRFRDGFYKISGFFIDLVDIDDFDYFTRMYMHMPENDGYMILMLFVRYFNITRDEFDEALERLRNWRLYMGTYIYCEEWEIPNADIIFTFNNDIIRYFYRRE